MNRTYTTDFVVNEGETTDTLEAEFTAAGLDFERREQSFGHPVYSLSGSEDALVAYLEAQGFEPTGADSTWEWDA